MEQEQLTFLWDAVRLAYEAEKRGNLPIGAVLVLDGEIIAQGLNTIWTPKTALTRHAEMEALSSAPAELWTRSREMTLYTTLEPCLMCAGAIMLHQIGRLVFGSTVPNGGVRVSLGALSPYFQREFARVEWIGPALPAECDPLYTRIQQYERSRS